MNPEITKIIDHYLAGELSEKDRAVFEERLRTNPQLQEELALQQDVMEGIKRASQRLKIKETRKNYFRGKLLKWGFISLSSIAILGIATYFVASMINSKIEPIPQELIEQLDKNAQFEQIKAQYFQIPAEGGIVMTADGVLLSVPKNAFLKDGKPYTGETIVQFQEAMNADDIVTSGLSTMSGDRLLETQGMFSLRSYTKDGEALEVNPKVGVYAQVPVDELKSGMQLFSGKKDATGNIDWQNPEPMYKLPVPVDMSELDFYPVDYEPYLNKLKWNTSKKSRDSLYLSFEEYFEEQKRDYMKQHEKGKKLFDVNCAICHLIDHNSTGPALRNARFLWDASTDDPNLLYTWVRDWELAAQQSEWARSRTMLSNTKHLDRENLSDEDIDMIFNYIDASPFSIAPPRFLTREERNYLYKDNRPIENYMTEEEAFALAKWTSNPNYADFEQIRAEYLGYEVIDSDSTSGEDVVSDAANAGEVALDNSYILPSKVLGFWNKQFNNTNLATRDFEKRMRSIHPTCNGAVLEKYVSQLNKPLSEIDREVAAMGYTEFEQFAAENIGKIDVNNPHLKNLQDFYSKAVNQFKDRSKKNRDKEKKRQEKWDKGTQQSREKEEKRRVYRETQALQEEYQFNLKNVKKQINASVGFTITHSPEGTVYNIDKYVWDATVNRESMDMLDPATGKRVKITYNDFSFNVPNYEKYIKLYAYVFPHELSSFQRIEGKNGAFSYPLNDDILYDISVVGITENGYEYYQKQTFKKGELGEISLKKTTEEQLKASITQLNKKRRGKTIPIGDEMQWLIREQKDYKEQKLRKEMEEFRQELSWRIFPCEGEFEEEPHYK